MTPNGIMSGGFLPIPAMLSMSLLMFVTSTFVTESYSRGAWLLPVGGSMEVWVPDLRCRWTSVEDGGSTGTEWLTKWGGRFDRTAAIRQFASRDPKASPLWDELHYALFFHYFPANVKKVFWRSLASPDRFELTFSMNVKKYARRGDINVTC